MLQQKYYEQSADVLKVNGGFIAKEIALIRQLDFVSTISRKKLPVVPLNLF